MQHSYVLSNKENDFQPQRSPLRLKMNYQDRQRYNQRSKSPLGQQSSYRKFNFADTKDNMKQDVSVKRRDFAYRYTDESNRKTFKDTNHNFYAENISEPPKIKAQNRNLENNNLAKINEVMAFDEKSLKADYRTFQKSGHRQNSKHLGFFQKVDNLQKINHQISNLLSYVNENKSKKDPSIQKQTSYQPRYGMIIENSKSYQRRISALQRPKGPQPMISAFQTQNPDSSLNDNNQRRRALNYQLTIQNQQVRTSSSKKQVEIKRTPRSSIKSELSPKNFDKFDNKNISPLKNTKSQQAMLALSPAQSDQKLSKISANNPDLEFYYKSLKKRDEEIENFKKNLEKSTSKNFIPYDAKLQTEKFQNQQSQEKSVKKDLFLTRQEIEVYKDISRLSNTGSIGLSSTNKIDRLRSNIVKTPTNFQVKIPKTPIYQAQQVSSSSLQNSQIYNPKRSEQPLTSKIEEQIKKIQNQLKDCKKQKSYLREKYGNLLPKQKQPQPDSMSRKALRPQYQRQNYGLDKSTLEKKLDDERMYDSYGNKFNCRQKLNQADQQFYQNLRNRIVSQNQLKKKQQYQRKEQRDISKVEKMQTSHLSNREKDFEIMLRKVQITKPQTTRLGTLLAEKIEIDLKLREQREKLSKSKNSNKWNQLREYLSNSYGIDKTAKQLENLLTISSQQHNPFSPTQISSSKLEKKFSQNFCSQGENLNREEIQNLSSLLSESLNFVQIRLLHKFSAQKLKKQHFSFRELDLSSKGYLSLEDLICFVNLHSGKFYRNRDIIFLLKSIKLLQSNEDFNGSKGANQYKFSYEFLWNTLTDAC